MFKHILIPTDGSKLARRGARAGIRLAKALGARVSAVYVSSPPYVPPMYGEAAIYVPAPSPSEYRRISEQAARQALAPIEAEARAARVRCGTRHVASPHPWQGILKAARGLRCDAIAMASHGRGAVGGLILGSETTRVLAGSKIPVLVIR